MNTPKGYRENSNIQPNNNDTFQLFNYLILILTKITTSLSHKLSTFHIHSQSMKLITLLTFVLIVTMTSPLQDIEYIEITDSLLYSAFYPNQKVNRITYSDIAIHNRSSFIDISVSDTIDIISNLYYDGEHEGIDYSIYKDLISKSKINNHNKNNKDNSLSSLIYSGKNRNKESFNHKNSNSKNIGNLYKLYGNKTIFKLELEDLEQMVNQSILSESQALFLWDVLIKERTDRIKYLYNKYLQKKANHDIYLFNFIPLKAFIFSLISFFLFYCFMLKTYVCSIKNSFTYNTIGGAIVFLIIQIFYNEGYYFASGVLFIQFIYFIKCTLDAILLKIGFVRDEFEIFSTNLSANTLPQFINKFIILSILTIVSGILSIKTFNYCLNYIVFYLSLFTLIVFISNSLELKSPNVLKPLKNCLIVMLGMFNFLLSKFHKSISHFNILSSQNILLNFTNSLYFVSDIFTIFCFHYLNGFLQFQINNNKLLKGNVLCCRKKFSCYDDSVWLIGFMLSFVIGIIGIIKKEFMCYVISMYVIKIVIDYFAKIFRSKLTRCVNNLIIVVFLNINYIITEKSDMYLCGLFSKNIGQQNTFVMYLCKVLGLIQIMFFILLNFDFSMACSDEEEDDKEIIGKVKISQRIDKNKKKKLKIQVIRPRHFDIKSTLFSTLDFILNYINSCIVFYISKYWEGNYFCLFLYGIILLIFLLRNYFLITEMKSDMEYLYSFIISLILNLRLLILATKLSMIYCCICNMNIFGLILMYCLIDKRKTIITCLIALHLLAECLILNSNFLFIDLLVLIFVPISFGFIHGSSPNSNRDIQNFVFDERVIENSNGCSYVFFIPTLVLFVFQWYGFKNVRNWMLYVNDSIKIMLHGKDLMQLFIALNVNEKKNEFFFMNQIFNWLRSL